MTRTIPRTRASATCTISVLIPILAACEPALDQRLDVIASPRILAITSSPAEVVAGAAASYTILAASPSGPLTTAPSWDLCTAPKPPTDDDSVSTGCIDTQSALVALGTGPTATATIPANACMQFGPDVPPGGFRPRDPDSTGGYYQPVRASADDIDAGLAFGFTRITCNLPGVTAELLSEYLTEYVANQNPTLEPLALAQGDAPIAPAAVPASSAITLTAAWPAQAVESYLYYDPVSQTLITRREAMRVSWFTTAGAIAVDASAVGEGDDALTVSTTWTTPSTPGAVWLWLVLRDSRGGMATQTVAVTVQ
jgi:hypothetical protein